MQRNFACQRTRYFGLLMGLWAFQLVLGEHWFPVFGAETGLSVCEPAGHRMAFWVLFCQARCSSCKHWLLLLAPALGSGSRQGLKTLPEFWPISQALSQTIPIIMKLLLLPTSLLRGKPQSLCHAFGMRSLQTTCPFEWREPMNCSTACEKCSHTATIPGRALWML